MEELLLMGFEEGPARNALRSCGGNVERAIDYLLSGSADDVQVQAQSHAHSGLSDTVLSLDVSQYSYGAAGSSACTSIACAVVKHLLRELKTGNDVCNREALRGVVQEGVRYYQTVLSSREHLSVDELGNFMTASLNALDGGPMQGILNSNSRSTHWEDLFQHARDRANPADYIGVVITKPPETVCIILPPVVNSTGRAAQYVFFDSHSRPQLGLDGAYLAVSADQRGLVERLNSVFTALPMERGSEDNYMMQMYNMFEGFGFQCKVGTI